MTFAVLVLAGAMVAISALTSRGDDLRPDRNTDLTQLLAAESARNNELAGRVSDLQREVDELSRAKQPGEVPGLTEEADRAQMSAMRGPGLTVTLDDAPSSVEVPGVDDDLLVVHQQDIQAVVNALWSGGAEAMTIQGQRVISTTGVKCVGNTVVLHGIPYAPPYRITAIGDPVRLQAALDSSEPIRIYQQYVAAYGLGYSVKTEDKIEMPPFERSTELKYARPRTTS
ncbi:DUF881 domain-containing protein [Enemella sp. A6]|uniref:DUF881 domain-containing protein n=1 Tax=Enemella sp. A6 TaxID=3440152 RepID=UPI003EC06F14